MRQRRRYRWWTLQEEEMLKKLFRYYTKKEIAEILGRSYASINSKGYVMGLRKHEARGG